MSYSLAEGDDPQVTHTAAHQWADDEVGDGTSDFGAMARVGFLTPHCWGDGAGAT